MGGMSALSYLQQDPQSSRHLLIISSSPNSEPYSIAIRSLQRELIVSDPEWNGGDYDDENWPIKGMRMARKLGMLSYRSSEEWRTRFGRRKQDYFPTELFGMNFEVHHGGNSLNNWANLHVILAIKNTQFFEVLLPHAAHKYGIVEDIAVDKNGHVHAPDKPGLGAEIDFDLIEKKKVAVLS